MLSVTSDPTFIAAEADAYDEAASVEATIKHDLAHPRRSLGSTPAASASRKTARDSRAPGCLFLPSGGCHPVRAPHGLPMDGLTPGIWVRLHVAPSFPGVGRGRRLQAAVGQAADRVRRAPNHPVPLA